MKKAIKKWFEEFMIDPIFNGIMYILCAILFIVMILMFIVICKQIF